MKTPRAVGQIPLILGSDLRGLSFATVCTPPVENSEPVGVASGGKDGQGVCSRVINPRQAAAVRARRVVFEVRYSTADYRPVVTSCVGLDAVADVIRGLLVDGVGPLHVVATARGVCI